MTTVMPKTEVRAVPRRGRKIPQWQRDLPRFIALCIQALIFLAPLYWMISTSFKPEGDTTASPPQWIPANPTLENYRDVLNTPDANLLRWGWNSLFTSGVSAIVHVALCTLTAYALARMRFKGRDTWFWFLLSSLMIPGIVTLIPSFKMMIDFGWINTYHALIWTGIPAVFGVFLLRQFFITIPRELEEAAKLDGANHLQILWFVIVPLAVPALVTLFVFAFLAKWNDYLWPLYVTQTNDMLTLPIGLSFFASRWTIEYGKLMASAALTAIPAVVAYLLAQRYIVQGLTVTGLKE